MISTPSPKPVPSCSWSPSHQPGLPARLPQHSQLLRPILSGDLLAIKDNTDQQLLSVNVISKVLIFSFGPLGHSASTQWIKQISGSRTPEGNTWKTVIPSVKSGGPIHLTRVEHPPWALSCIRAWSYTSLNNRHVSQRKHSYMPKHVSQISKWHTGSRPGPRLTGLESVHLCLSLGSLPGTHWPHTFPFLSWWTYWLLPTPQACTITETSLCLGWETGITTSGQDFIQINAFCEMID